MSGDVLLFIGIALMVLAVVGAIAAAVVLRLSGKRLRARMETEYGKRRH